MHYFDPSKKGQKFEYQLPKRNVAPDPLAAQTVVTADQGRTLLDNKAEQSSVQKGTAIEEKHQVEGEEDDSNNKRLLDELFVISRIIKGEVASAWLRLITPDNPYRDLDYSGYHKNRI